MLAALGVGKSSGPRWPAAKKLQKEGKAAKKMVILYLETAARELSNAETVEALVRLKLAKKDDEEVKKQMNQWQLELMEHCGMESKWGQEQVQHWLDQAGDSNSAGNDQAINRPRGQFEHSARTAVAAADQEAMVRERLMLRKDGADEDNAGDALMPRRFPKKADGKMQTVGPISRTKLLTWLQDATQVVLSLETRTLLSEVLKDYATWKQEDKSKLCTCLAIRWQAELWEQMGIDRRLGQVEALRPPEMNDEEGMRVRRAHIEACKALSLWYTTKVNPASLPKADRRIEPFSLLDQTPDPCTLQEEGSLSSALLEQCLRKIASCMAEEWGDAVEEAAAQGDLFCVERWTREIYEGYGLQHEYGMMMFGAMSYYPELAPATVAIAEATKKLKQRTAMGLRKKQAAQSEAAAKPEGPTEKEGAG